jgi:hypothetical protein
MCEPNKRMSNIKDLSDSLSILRNFETDDPILKLICEQQKMALKIYINTLYGSTGLEFNTNESSDAVYTEKDEII